MSKLGTHVKDLEDIYEEARIAFRDIEVIVRKHFGWFEYLDENKVARYVYEILVDFFGRTNNNQSIGFKSTRGIGFKSTRVPFFWIFWPFVKNFYRCAISNLTKIFFPFKKKEISNKVLFLPVTEIKPHSLSILQGGLQEKYPCLTMVLTGNTKWWKIPEVLRRKSSYVEMLFSIKDSVKDIFKFWRIMAKTFATNRAYEFKMDITKGLFVKYGIEDAEIKRIIFRRLLYGFFDNVEYCQIGKRISMLSPLAVISDVTTVGKVAFIMSYLNLNRVNVLTIGLQHGIVTDTHRYFPASRYFGCASLYALEKLQGADPYRSEFYFLGGLPEQMTWNHSDRARNTRIHEFGLGIVDSNDRIRMLLRQLVEILRDSKWLPKMNKIYVKRHPRFRRQTNFDYWMDLPNVRDTGISDWETFSSRVNIAITLSYDAIYELLRRKIVTIVLNPAKRMDTKKFPEFNNLKFIKDSVELDSVLGDMSAGAIKWNSDEEQEIWDFLDYVYGKSEESRYVESVVEVIDSWLARRSQKGSEANE